VGSGAIGDVTTPQGGLQKQHAARAPARSRDPRL
jgi:hypothetical protein